MADLKKADIEVEAMKQDQAEFKKQFDVLQNERKQHQTRINQIDTELVKLMGKYDYIEEKLNPKKIARAG